MTDIPNVLSLSKAAEICIKTDKPLQLDYFVPSLYKQCKIARDEDSKVLWKNDDEMTSPLKSMFKVDNGQSGSDFILETQNSVYLVSGLMF
tara:strand:+ start:13519 stop:13791 length:273 start_codon:yes stop_codon:yes gene_type:complete